DAALALLELELPQWKLRRLIYEDGEWHCSLSKHIELPVELDDAAEANHDSLPLSILSALVEARRHSLTTGEPAAVRAAGSSYAGICHLLRQFCLIRQSREERVLAKIVGLRSNRNDGRKRQPIVISASGRAPGCHGLD